MRGKILRLALVLLASAGPAAAQTGTTITGTFKTAGQQTPAQAGLKIIKSVATINVYGTVSFVPGTVDAAGRFVVVREVTCGGVTYVPQPTIGYIRDTGVLMDEAGGTGVKQVPNSGCSPAGLATRAEIFFNASVTEPLRRPATTLFQVKVVPDQATADWAALAVAAVATPAIAFQAQSNGSILDKEIFAAAPDPGNAPASSAHFWFEQTTLKMKCKTATGADCNPAGAGGSVPTGTGFRHVTAGAEDAAAKLVANADVDAAAAIVDTKLAQIATASKVSGAALTLLPSVPAGAGQLPLANLPFGTANQLYKTNALATAIEQATLTTGTAGTDFAVAFAAGSITLNLPTASATARGALASADWTTFNNKVPATRTLIGGAGIAALGDLSVDRTIATASGEADFLASGALVCGAATQGKMQVHTTPLQYCDNAATPALQYAAYGDSAGAALTGDSATAFFAAGTLEDARLSANVALTTRANTFGAFVQTFQAGANFRLVDPTDTTKIAQFDLSNIATATTRTINVPNANSTLAQAFSAPANQFLTAISAQGVFSAAQPAFTNLSGSLACSQAPALTGDVTSSAGSCVTALANIPSATPMAGSLLATNIVAPASPAAGKVSLFTDSTELRLHDKNASGVIGTTVVADTGAANNFLTAVSAAGAISKAQPSFANLSGSATDAQIPDTITASNYLLLAGGTLTGKLVTVASAAGSAGLNLPAGVAPTSPVIGDVWNTGLTIQFRDNAGTPATRTLVDATRLISTTTPLGGGGDLSADRTLTCTTCTTNAAALTIDQVVVGAAGQATKILAAGAAANVLTMSAGIPTWAAPGGGTSHAILSATHTDTVAATVVRGDLMVGQSVTPSWQRLALGAANTFLGSNATDTAWTAPTGGGTVLGTGRTLTGGAGIAALGDLSVDRTIATASGEADFLASGALTCGAATQGKAQVHTTPLQYCDNAAIPALQYAAYGDSAGAALTGDSATAFFAAGTLEDARLSANVALTTRANTFGAFTQDSEGASVTRPFRRLAFASFPATCTINREFLERSDPATAGQVVYVCNAAGTGWDLVGDGGGGGASWNAITNPTAAQALTMGANNTTWTWDSLSGVFKSTHTSAFTTGPQFLIEQITGNPTGGTLLEARAADVDVIALKAGDGTGYTRVLKSGSLEVSVGAEAVGNIDLCELAVNGTDCLGFVAPTTAIATADAGRYELPPLPAAAGFLRAGARAANVSVLTTTTASGTGACTNQFTRALNDAAAPTCATVAVADVSAPLKTWSLDVTLDTPTTADTNKVQWYLPSAGTITRVACSVGAATSVTIQLDKRAEATPNTAGTDAMTAALACTTTSGTTTSFASAAVAARIPLNLQITAVSGTPGSLRVHVEGTVD